MHRVCVVPKQIQRMYEICTLRRALVGFVGGRLRRKRRLRLERRRRRRLGKTLLSYLPSWSLQISWGMVVVFHGLESLYVLHLCRKHRTGLVVGVSPLLFGSEADLTVHSRCRRSISSGRSCLGTLSSG